MRVFKFTILFLALTAVCFGQGAMQATYVRSGYAQTPDPTFSPISPYVGAATSVTISDVAANPSATISYCTDTNNTCAPTTPYTGAISVSATGFIRAVAKLIGVADSNIVSWQGTISGGSPITHVASGTACSKAVGGINGAAATVSFTCTPGAANRALILGFECASGTGPPTTASIAASPSTGWTFQQLNASGGNTSSEPSGARFAAWGTITPNTTSTTFTATFSGGGTASCNVFTGAYGDEWITADPTGGTTTFYNFVAGSGASGCAPAAVTSNNANDAVWSLCLDSLATTGWAGTGWSTGVNDLNGDATIFKVGSGSLTPTFGGSPVSSGNSGWLSGVIKAQ